MIVDLVQVSTRDGVRLDGMVQAPARPTGPLDAVLCVHGTGSNFYASTLFDSLAARMLERGVGVVRINTRGHDLMSNASLLRGGGRRLGAAYEVLDDCRHDLAAWIEWTRAAVGPRVGLVGHSSGALKCLYALAHEPNPIVQRVIALSPPRLSHALFTASPSAAEFRNTFEQARQLVAAGEPAALLEVRLPLPFVVTAAGYVEKYGPDERYDYLRFLARVQSPVLMTFGEQELANNMAFRGVVEAVRETAPAVHIEVLPGGDHFYTTVRDELLDRITTWLA